MRMYGPLHHEYGPLASQCSMTGTARRHQQERYQSVIMLQMLHQISTFDFNMCFLFLLILATRLQPLQQTTTGLQYVQYRPVEQQDKCGQTEQHTVSLQRSTKPMNKPTAWHENLIQLLAAGRISYAARTVTDNKTSSAAVTMQQGMKWQAPLAKHSAGTPTSVKHEQHTNRGMGISSRPYSNPSYKPCQAATAHQCCASQPTHLSNNNTLACLTSHSHAALQSDAAKSDY
jgi:hypothetical protein